MTVSTKHSRPNPFFRAGAVMLLVGFLAAGCTGLTFAATQPDPSASPTLAPSATSHPLIQEPSSTPGPLPSPSSIVETPVPQINPQEDRIILSFSQSGFYHLFAYFPISQPFVQLTSGKFDDRDPAVSPDGTRVAFSSDRDGFWDLYLLDLSTLETTQLTDTPAYDGAPSWSPDGQWLTYETNNGSNFDIVIMPVFDRSVPAVQLTQNSGNNFSPCWSPAGREIVFTSDRSGSDSLWIARLDLVENRFVQVLGNPGAIYTSPSWSPDGTMLAWTKTIGGKSTVETAAISEINTRVRSYGQGIDPIWSQDGTALLIKIQAPNTTYLVAYKVDDGSLLFPAEHFPSSVHGMDWRTATLINKLDAADPQPDLKGVFPLFHILSSDSAGFSERQSLEPLPGVDAPYPYLHPAAIQPFASLREAAGQKLGWDFLAKLDDADLPITAPPQPGIVHNWLFTGRAINVISSPLQAGWMTIEREDFDGQVFWRLWVRCLNQDGSCGEPQRLPSWDFSARYNGDHQAYEEGGKTGLVPSGYWVDFTDLALTYGWERLPAQNNWRSYFQGTLFNQFVFRQSLSWNDAMLQLYPADVARSLDGDDSSSIQP